MLQGARGKRAVESSVAEFVEHFNDSFQFCLAVEGDAYLPFALIALILLLLELILRLKVFQRVP